MAAKLTYEGISNYTTAHVTVRDVPASRVCGSNKYVVLVAIFLDKARQHLNMTKLLKQTDDEGELSGNMSDDEANGEAIYTLFL